jgi:hypothetical protein
VRSNQSSWRARVEQLRLVGGQMTDGHLPGGAEPSSMLGGTHGRVRSAHRPFATDLAVIELDQQVSASPNDGPRRERCSGAPAAGRMAAVGYDQQSPEDYRWRSGSRAG